MNASASNDSRMLRTWMALILCAGIAGCNRPPAEAPSPTAPRTSVDTPAPTVDHNCIFCADPSFVRTCEIAKGIPTTLYWNVENPAITQVGIFVVDDAGKDSSFARQPPSGSILTGPWLKPGLTFKLKDPAGRVLQTVKITGKDC